MPRPDLNSYASQYETVALVLQGGGALGAYQAGVYEGLHEAGIRPNWFAGISIGAINAAIIAGNPPERRLERLREFWDLISRPALFPRALDWQELTGFLPLAQGARTWANILSAGRTLVEGQAGFFLPRSPVEWFGAFDGSGPVSYYDSTPLQETLERLVDFDRLNGSDVRMSVGAVNLRSGNFVFFDSANMRLGPRHIMASGALPPGFPPVDIDGEQYWDGGLVSNTPLAYVLETTPRNDTLAFQVDLWSARGPLPQNLPDALERQKDIQYSSRTRMLTSSAIERQRVRRTIHASLAQLPPEIAARPEVQRLRELACTKAFNVVHLIYQTKHYEGQSKDYEFGPTSLREHWQAGLADIRRTLAKPERLARPPGDTGVTTHDYHREDEAS